LHLGHAKAIVINFETARQLGGLCYLRFDDTNPDKEQERFVSAIQEGVAWLGYHPSKITFSSDYFEEIRGHAVRLIRSGDAYVCS